MGSISSAKQMVLSAVLDNGVRRESHSARGNSPIPIIYLTVLETTIRLYWLRHTPIIGPNKTIRRIAGVEYYTNLGLPPEIGRVSRSGNAEDNKPETYRRDQLSEYILSRICRCVWDIVLIYIH